MCEAAPGHAPARPPIGEANGWAGWRRGPGPKRAGRRILKRASPAEVERDPRRHRGMAELLLGACLAGDAEPVGAAAGANPAYPAALDRKSTRLNSSH